MRSTGREQNGQGVLNAVPTKAKSRESSDGGGETSPWDTPTPFPELGGRYLRVITLADKVTILNAFPDRGFKP
jgi:hypothetical protein